MPLGGGDLLERPAEMDGRRPTALLGPPRDRGVEREVELEDARAVPVALEPSPVPVGEPATGDPQELARREVEEHRAARR
ncbi:MAG: hypothetical protein U0R69_00515 [Gaiellales bacterium]